MWEKPLQIQDSLSSPEVQSVNFVLGLAEAEDETLQEEMQGGTASESLLKREVQYWEEDQEMKNLRRLHCHTSRIDNPVTFLDSLF
jgi:hypothetical protein